MRKILTVFTLFCLSGLNLANADELMQVPGATATQKTTHVLLAPVDEATLSSQFTGQIKRLPLRTGDTFKAGDTLVDFNCELQEVELQKAQATLEGSQVAWQSVEKLERLESASKIDVATAKSKYKHASIEVKRLDTLLRQCVVKAPYDGRVVEVMANAHEVVKPGQPLLAIINDNKLELELYVPSTWLTWLKASTPFDVKFDENPTNFHAHITKIGAKIDSASQTVPIIGMLDNPNQALISGMSGQAAFKEPTHG